MRSEDPRHLPQLDALRGIAVALVLSAHSPLGKVFSFGWLGVDLFFVLSGFLITGILLDSRGGPGYFRNFFARRALRIWPLYYVVLFAVAILGSHVYPDDNLGYASGYLLPSSLYLQNFGAVWEGPRVLRATWSLAVEEQFYLLWPMAVALLPRKPFWWVCAGILVLSPVLRYGLLAEGFRGEDIYAWTLTRADGFAAGALVSIIVRSDGFSVARARLIALGVLVSSTLALPFTIRWGLGSAVHVPRNPAAYALIFSAASVASASLLGLCLTSQRFAKWMNREPLRLLGRVSYGLYVYHLPVFFLVHLRLAPLVDSWFQLGHSLSLAVSWALAFALLLLTAWCSYRWLETPFLRLKKRFTAPSARGPS